MILIINWVFIEKTVKGWLILKDLKHLIYLENLLQNANNELITQAKSEGKICVGYLCENSPEPLLNVGNAFSVRLTAPNSGSMDIATYYMTNLLCETSRAILERAVEGGFNFADCLITPDGCTMLNRGAENIELLHAMGKDNDKFFYQYMEIPMKADENGVSLLKVQSENHILKPLHEVYGVDISQNEKDNNIDILSCSFCDNLMMYWNYALNKV